MKYLTIAVVIGVLVIGSYYFIKSSPTDTPTELSVVVEKDKNPATTTQVAVEPRPEPVVEEDKTKTIVGTSVENRPITAYHYGTGETELLFVGGIHGGYSWNTALVAYELMDYLKENPNVIPKEIRVTVIPVLNPDGLTKVVGTADMFKKSDVSTSEDILVSGRFNAHDVDLNRNFDCDWQSSGTWQNKVVSGGNKTFSEPESQAFREYITSNTPDAVIVWYSASGGVFASNCHSEILEETTAILNVYSKASGYMAYKDFDFYAITGDMVNWLAKNKIPAISVLLTNHTDTEWNKNQAGIEALFKYYAK
ncbi:hypothetical protein IPH92_02120 [Candidatus Kaiserbacteria bacterium]|nr:MAG: hypothetical protein IPH92_02120 [Candidatus Kaiserbacteria bacterium]